MRVVDGRPEPFPTLFWLACPAVTRTIARLEHSGWIEAIEREVDSDPVLRHALERDHAAYAAEREGLLSESERRLLADFGLLEPLRQRGIGGSRSLTRLKCLHLHYAHHLARGSAIGRRIESVATISPCAVESSPEE